jgi:hypothetical protein
METEAAPRRTRRADTETNPEAQEIKEIMISKLDGAYKGDEMTEQVARILGMPDCKFWSVVDRYNNLALVHYSQNADMSKYGNLRGIVVDVEVGAVVSHSFGHTPVAVADHLIVENNTISVKDEDGIDHVFPAASSNVRICFEGVLMYAIWHKGEMVCFTHRKFMRENSQSRWGNSKPFYELFRESGNLKPEQMFDVSKPYSSSCYIFLIADQSLIVASRQSVVAPYLVLLSRLEMDCKRAPEEIGAVVPFTPTTTMMEDSPPVVTQSAIHIPRNLTDEEANLFLSEGYYSASPSGDDPRMGTGEAVILCRYQDGIVVDIVKVHSPAYDWRWRMRGNNSNIMHQFHLLLNTVYPDQWSEHSESDYRKKFIIFPLYSEESIKQLYEENGVILRIPNAGGDLKQYDNRDARIHLLWLNFVLSLPAHLQGEALGLQSKFKEQRVAVIDWLSAIEGKFQDIEETEYSVRVKTLITVSRRLSRERIERGENFSRAGVYMKMPVLIKSTLRNLINKENGPSLYALVRDMRREEKQRVEAERVKAEEAAAMVEDATIA